VTDDSMLNKIKALLYKAERTDSPDEAQALSAKAAELMAKYSIDQALLDATRSKSDREKPGMHRESFKGVPYYARKLVLFYVIAEVNGCKGIRMDNETVYIYGFQSDIDMAVMLYYSILVQAERELARTRIPRGENARSFRTSFWAYYTHRIGERIKESIARTKQEAAKEPGTALVLRDRSLEVISAYKAAHPRTRTTLLGSGTSAFGAQAGEAAANRADLGGAASVGRRSAGALA